MKRPLFTAIKLVFFTFLFQFAVTSCAPRACPAVAGTGNSTARGYKISKRNCPSVSGTGNRKPKVSKKKAKEDGLFDPKMAKAMAKKKNAKPIEKRKLSFD